MRNLKNIQHLMLKPGDGARPSACAWDVSTDTLICAFGPTKDGPVIRLSRWHHPNEDGSWREEPTETIAYWDSLCPLPELDCDHILDLHYFSDTSTTCLVLAGGDLVVVREKPFTGEEKIEIVGSVDAGITAAAWSPDEELLAICTKTDTFLYMTRDFSNVVSSDITAEDLKASKHVSVGWGKSETQFKGKGAKALRDPTMPEKVDKGLLSNKDDQGTTISWRGDGSYVAVNSLQASDRRVIRVFSREGTLDGVTEPVDYMENCLSWRPAGNLLASIQRLEDWLEVIFFERNGLRHGQFKLRLTREEADEWGSSVQLKWNVDSSIIAVCFQDRVQLWTMGNYHYYLKQEIRLCGSGHAPPYFSWHPEQPLLFAVCSDDGFERLEYLQRISGDALIHANRNGIVAVVDGTTAKLTPFRLANIPPPMSLQGISVSRNIIDVAIADLDSASTMVAILSERHLWMYRWSLAGKLDEVPALKYTQELPRLPGPNASDLRFWYQQVVFADDLSLLILACDGHESFVYKIEILSADLKVSQAMKPGLIQEILPKPLLGSTDPKMLRYGGQKVETLGPEAQSNEAPNRKERYVALPGRADRLLISQIVSSPHRTNQGAVNGDTSVEIVFGLMRNGSLYADQRCLTKTCTSFTTTDAHLIFTTAQNCLKFVHLAPVDALELPPDISGADERCRSIERGAKIVTVIPETSALILQMPRGNLETIYPRALVLAGIRRCINDRKYKKAFFLCRNHRVDMNILYDHAPKQLLDNVELFIDQIKKVEHIDLFLSQLRNENVSETMYKETLPSKDLSMTGPEALPPGQGDASKVDRICDAFIRALSSRSSTNLQNIITSHVCKTPPDLGAGLQEVSKLQRVDSKTAEMAVEHICFLVDVNKLYDNALGLYDINLTLLVAQQSQKDPREYLPFLQKLQDQPELRMKFDIDDYLRRHNKGLVHLRDLQAFEELKSYTVKHSLYDDALRLYRYQDSQINEIMALYADYLHRSSKHKEAGAAFEYLHDYVAALEAYRLAHMWREALSCAMLVPLDGEQLRSLASTIAESLMELKDYHSAATVHLDHLGDIEAAVRLFCKGYFFGDASRVLVLHNRRDLLETVFDPGLVEGQASMTELLAECRGQLNAQIPRLRDLRVKKEEEPLAFYDADANQGVDIPDNVSLAGTDASTTGGSLFTRYTNRTGTVGTNTTRQTSKNKRREERKRARGKKGSVYEEEYLVNSVGRLIERVNAIGDEVQRLVVALMRRSMRERARAVEATMSEVVELCKNCVGEVFQNNLKEDPESKPKGGGVQRPAGGDGVYWDSIEETRTRREAPVVKDFERLVIISR